MFTSPESFYNRSSELLERAWAKNEATLKQVAPIIGKSIAKGGVLHTFGSGHSDLIAREIVGRAGGLACVTSIVDPTEGFIENLPGYGTKLVERYDRQYAMIPGEVVIVVSNSGKNASPVDVALYAKQKGLIVVGVTCLAMSHAIPSEHSSGYRLFEVADYVLDNCGVVGDAILELSRDHSGDGNGDSRLRAGPTSGLIGTSLLNWLILATIDWLRVEGHPVPVLKSQNLPDGLAHNRTLAETYNGRLSRPFA